MSNNRTSERVQVVVIGGGQAGLSVGYCLAQRGLSFVILEANQRVGDSWRKRWDSLRLFTPARYDGLIGLPFPGAALQLSDEGRDGRLPRGLRRAFRACPSAPASRSIACGVTARGTSWTPATGGSRPITSSSRWPPTRRRACRSSRGRSIRGIVQLHSSQYKNPGQLQPGDVLLVGAGQFRGRHRARRRAIAPHVAVRAASRPRAVPHRQPRRARPAAGPLSRSSFTGS